MTTEAMPTVSQFIAMKLASRARKRAIANEASNRVSALIKGIVRLVLHLAGFACLTFAGFTWNMAAGLVVAGISCFVLSWLNTGEDQTVSDVRRAPDLRTGR